MLSRFIHGRVYAFIDAANILYSQQTLGWRVDYAKLKAYLKRECDLRGLFYYTGHVGTNEKQQKFLRRLQHLGYSVHCKEVKRIRVGADVYLTKGNLDVELAIDAVLNIEHYDTLLLMSGDSDFAYLLDTVKSRGKRIIVMSARGHIAQELFDRAKHVRLNRLRRELEFLPKKEPPRAQHGGRCDC